MVKQTICLNMIVKDEAPVIRRCLASVRPFIDSWVIVDTGSTDGTQEIIRQELGGLPGELHERPWVDFAHNRTEALALAQGRADYIFVIDADEVLQLATDFVLPHLTADAYLVQVRYGGCSYVRKQLIRDGRPWRYEGVLHEYLASSEPHTEAPLPGLTTIVYHDGARARDPQTYRRDALLLEKALLQEPDNKRYVFYLAQSYRDAGDFELALRHYRRRVEMGGWGEEVWFSLYQIAQLGERQKRPWPEVMEAYLAAHQFCPDRAGPLFRIAMHYQVKREYNVSHLFLARTAAIPQPAAYRLFVEWPLYEYQIAVEHAVASHYVGDHQTAIAVSNALLRGGKLPPQAVDQIIRNRRFSVDALVPKNDLPRREPGRLRVVVIFRDPGPELDDCVESLLRQDFEQWEAVFIDDGSVAGHGARLPLEDPRVSYVRHAATRGRAARLAESLPAEADPDLVVLPLSASDRLAESDALTQIRTAFADPDCWLVFGQYRTPEGALGDAEPATCADDFRRAVRAWRAADRRRFVRRRGRGMTRRCGRTRASDAPVSSTRSCRFADGTGRAQSARP